MIFQRLRCACLFVASFAGIEQATAITTSWNTNSTGSYTNAANWSAGVPTSGDTAVFNRNVFPPYSVTFPGRPIVSPLVREVSQIRVGTNVVSFSDSVNLNQLPASFKVDSGNTLVENAVIIGDTSGQAATLNTTLADFSASSITIGNAAGSIGTLNVSGGMLNVTQTDHSGTDEFYVGKQGAGTLNVSGGADVIVTGKSHLADASGSSAAVVVSGAGSSWQTETVTSGSGTSSIAVESGGRLDVAEASGNFDLSVTGTGSLLVANAFTATGEVSIANGAIAESVDVTAYRDSEVSGAGSSWTISNSLRLLTESYTFRILSGGTVTTPSVQLGLVGQLTNWDGRLEVGGDSTLAATVVNVGTDMNPTDPNRPRGTLTLADGGTIDGRVDVSFSGTLQGKGSVTGNVKNRGVVVPTLLDVEGEFRQESGGKLRFEIGGTTLGVNYGQLTVGHVFFLAGTLEVVRVGGFVPQPGDTFDLLNFNFLIAPTVTVNLHPLPAPLKWDSSRLFSDGVLRAILPGDYNENGTVDAADYVVWREQLVSNPGQTLPNDDTLGVGFDDYNTWRTNFGNVAPSGPAAAVPEPVAAILVAIGLLSVSGLRRR